MNEGNSSKVIRSDNEQYGIWLKTIEFDRIGYKKIAERN
jgi:hypothetical protein